MSCASSRRCSRSWRRTTSTSKAVRAGSGTTESGMVQDATSAVRTESRRLRGKLELVLPALLATDRRLLGHPGLRALYPEYLVMTHGEIGRASCRERV